MSQIPKRLASIRNSIRFALLAFVILTAGVLFSSAKAASNFFGIITIACNDKTDCQARLNKASKAARDNGVDVISAEYQGGAK